MGRLAYLHHRKVLKGNHRRSESSNEPLEDEDEQPGSNITIVFKRACDHASTLKKVSTDNKLALYGLYKQATVGQCKTGAPSLVEMTERAKWSAWQKLGDMSRTTAMEGYIAFIKILDPSCSGVLCHSHASLSELQTSHSANNAAAEEAEESSEIEWSDNEEDYTVKSSTAATKPPPKAASISSSGGGGGFSMSQSVSVMKYDSDDEEVQQKDAFYYAKMGDTRQVQQYLQQGADVNDTDAEGRTCLHWATDGGHIALIQYLVGEARAQINSQDSSGCTALHYAAMCEHSECVKYLLDQKTIDVSVTDNDNFTAADVADNPDIKQLFESS